MKVSNVFIVVSFILFMYINWVGELRFIRKVKIRERKIFHAIDATFLVTSNNFIKLSVVFIN